jgi:hypothetical protein
MIKHDFPRLGKRKSNVYNAVIFVVYARVDLLASLCCPAKTRPAVLAQEVFVP